MNQVHEKKACGICGVNDDKTQYYLCGIYDYMHPKCADLAEKIVVRYIQYLRTTTTEELMGILFKRSEGLRALTTNK